MRDHPCLRCGACCAAFRVSFYRGECLPGPDAVPEEHVVDVAPFRVAMRGTERAPPRCSQLHGVVGEQVFCAIHPVRPTPCREFGASWEQGVVEPRCDEARARHGLPPLTEGDWAPGRPRTPGRRRAA